MKNGTEIFIPANSNKDLEDFIKKFNKKISRHMIISNFLEKRFYEKPSQKKARKRKESILRIKHEEKRNKLKKIK